MPLSVFKDHSGAALTVKDAERMYTMDMILMEYLSFTRFSFIILAGKSYT